MSERPVWICEVCSDPLQDNDGVIVISYTDINRHDDELRTWDEEHPGSIHDGAELESYPRDVPWHVLHDRCGGEDRYAPPYTIESRRIGTWEEVASWSAHLHGKAWFPYTTWDSLLRKAGAAEA